MWLVGETVTLQVNVSAVTSASQLQQLTWRWLKDGATIPFTNHTTVRNRTEDGGVLVLELQISGAAEDDSGLYSCEISSPFSSHSAMFERVMVVDGECLFRS